MNREFTEAESGKRKQADRETEICCHYGDYQVRLHFNGEKTLAQCMKDLAERRAGTYE